METDEEYRQGQKDCQDAWLEKNPGYWREYRKTHPEYRERNRELQMRRNERRKAQSRVSDKEVIA